MKNYIARYKTFNNLNVLEMGPLSFSNGEYKVTFTRLFLVVYVA